MAEKDRRIESSQYFEIVANSNLNTQLSLDGEPHNTTLVDTGCQLNSLISEQQQQIWSYKFYCKYTKIETEKMITKIKARELEIERLKSLVEKERENKEFLSKLLESSKKRLDDSQKLFTTMQNTVENLKEFLQLKSDKNELRLKEYEDNYTKAKTDFEATIPLFGKLQNVRSMCLKLFVERNMIVQNKLQIIDIVNTRNNIQDRLFFNGIVEFAKAVLDYKNNQKCHKEIIDLNKNLCNLSILYQEKRIENERKQMGFLTTNESSKSQWGSIPEIQDISLEGLIIKSGGQIPHKATEYSTTLKIAQKMKQKSEETKRKFENSRKSTMENLKRTLNTSRMNKSLDKSFSEMEKAIKKQSNFTDMNSLKNNISLKQNNNKTGFARNAMLPMVKKNDNKNKENIKNQSFNTSSRQNTSKNIKIIDQKVFPKQNAPFVRKEVHFSQEADERVFKKPKLMNQSNYQSFMEGAGNNSQDLSTNDQDEIMMCDSPNAEADPMEDDLYPGGLSPQEMDGEMEFIAPPQNEESRGGFGFFNQNSAPTTGFGMFKFS